MFRTIHSTFQTIINNIGSHDLYKTFKREYRELKDFYIDDQQRKKLESMNSLKRFVFTFWSIFKSMFNKLTPFRQILFIVAVFLIFVRIGFSSNGTGIGDNPTLGGLLLLLILLLELKDKLLAKSELHEGFAVQKALMPDEDPQVPGWDIWIYNMPANDVGGDLVDFIKLSDQRYALALADVSGKGLGAAILMAKLQSLIKAFAPDFTSLSAFVKKLNSIFYRDSLKQSFASLIYLEIVPGEQAIKLVNAGHLPPVLIKKDKIQCFDKGSRALGLSGDADYEEITFKMSSDELLLIYSDGLDESVNEKGDFYEKKLFDFIPRLNGLSARKAGSMLVNEVNNFCGTARRHDDLSLIIIKPC